MVSSRSKKKQSIKITHEGIEVFREFYPVGDDFITLECVWKSDKFILLERKHKRENESQEKEEVKLIGYSDSDRGGCVDDLKSTSGNLFTLGSGIFTWNSKKQETTVQSTTEVEYIVAASAMNQAIWLRKLLLDLGYEKKEPTEIKCDNLSAVVISKNSVFHGRTIHIKIKFHFIREVQQANEVSLVHCLSEDQLADLLTKALPKDKFESLITRIGVCFQSSKEEC